MAKNRSVFLCSACGHEEPKWLGRCPQCGEWNTLKEKTETPGKGRITRNFKTLPLNAIPLKEEYRFDSGMEELNRVLGGGIMRGSSVLLGGEPGIGKSTLMLTLAASIKTPGRVLYVTGEEAPHQLRIRGERIGAIRDSIEILNETDVEIIINTAESLSPVLIIIDSIQTLVDREIGSVPGTPNQIKFCCQRLTDWTKQHSASIFLIAHVTKEGAIAGPKLVEHMVDTVLYFDQSDTEIRFLRAVKNRFGSVHEIGLFILDEKGLSQIKDPSSLFLVARQGDLPAGVAVVPIYEGSRVLLVEIQALTVPAKGGISRVFSEKIDPRRVSRVAAVLEKNLSLRYSDQDLYVNVAGGIKIADVGIDLPLAMALYSARTGIPVPAGTVMAGELSLAGEIRPIQKMRLRVKTAVELGFTRFLGPQKNGEETDSRTSYIPVSSLKKGIESTFPLPQKTSSKKGS